MTHGVERAPDPTALAGRIVVVAGATRGAGRGIAAAFGELGATVICTGRSSRTNTLRSDCDRPETIEETAELVTSLGGVGIAVPVDHLDPEQVERLAGRIRADHGHIDVLINDIWGGEQLKGGPAQWNTPIWELDLADGLRILRLGIDTHVITSHYLLPLLIERPGGLLVEVTDGTRDYNDSNYRISVFYDLVKVAVNRLAFSKGHELVSHEATAVAVTQVEVGTPKSRGLNQVHAATATTGMRLYQPIHSRLHTASAKSETQLNRVQTLCGLA